MRNGEIIVVDGVSYQAELEPSKGCDACAFRNRSCIDIRCWTLDGKELKLIPVQTEAI